MKHKGQFLDATRSRLWSFQQDGGPFFKSACNALPVALTHRFTNLTLCRVKVGDYVPSKPVVAVEPSLWRRTSASEFSIAAQNREAIDGLINGERHPPIDKVQKWHGPYELNYLVYRPQSGIKQPEIRMAVAFDARAHGEYRTEQEVKATHLFGSRPFDLNPLLSTSLTPQSPVANPDCAHGSHRLPPSRPFGLRHAGRPVIGPKEAVFRSFRRNKNKQCGHPGIVAAGSVVLSSPGAPA